MMVPFSDRMAKRNISFTLQGGTQNTFGGGVILLVKCFKT